MFENRYPLLEVVQAIEELRESRGTTNKEICDFVRQQGRNPNDPMKILKTIRTLNKLVEEGVLIKKGKRYMLPAKPPELADNAEGDGDDCDEDEGEEGDEGKEEEEGDECDDDEEGKQEEGKQEEPTQEEPKQEEAKQEEEEEEEEEDDDDDDDDDDDEEEEDDDDDDDEEEEEEGCGDTESKPEPERKPTSLMDKTASKGLSKHKSPLGSGEPKPQDIRGANEERTDNLASKTSDIVNKKNTLKSGRKSAKGQNCEAKNNGKNKGGETIAFCARDFIDSQLSQNNTQTKPVTLQEKPQDNLIKTENYETESVARAFGLRRRESINRKHRGGDDCRSRSPIRGQKKNNFFTDIRLDHSDNLRKNMISSQIFQEMTDTPMDIDRDNEVVDLDFDIMGHRSPIGPSSPITPGVHLDRTESCCSQTNNPCPENIKTEPDFDCKTQFFLKKNADYKHSRHSMARAIDMQSKRLAAEKDKEKLKRDIRSEDGNVVKAEKRASLCSVCEKKKRNS